jgi:hypothetical protein
MFFRLLLFGLIAMMVVRFLFRYVLPILHLTRSANDRLRTMQQRMEDLEKRPQSQPRKKEGEYIEYEEVS